MNSNSTNKLLEYLSLFLVLSFFLLHNIILVEIGILLSIYIINKNYVVNIIKFITPTKKGIEDSRVANTIEIDRKKEELNENDSVIQLVQRVEELGFIPSKNKNDKSNAA